MLGVQAGHVDVAGQIVSGWAVDTGSSSGFCVLDIFVGNRKRLSFVSGGFIRSDVAAARKIFEDFLDCGFLIDISTLLGNLTSRIEVRFGGSSRALEGNNPFFASLAQPRFQVFQSGSGYSYFVGDKNSVIDQTLGKINATESTILTWAFRFCVLEQIQAKHNKKFIAAVVSDKIAIAPAKLSEEMSLAASRTVHRVAETYKSLFNLELLYPLQYLLDITTLETLIVKTDSHLSWKAHYYIFIFILEKANIAIEHEISWEVRPALHDLAVSNELSSFEEEAYPVFKREFEPSSISSASSYAEYYLNPFGSIPVVVIIGNSSAMMLARFFSQVCKRLIVIKRIDPDMRILSELGADLIIHYTSERNLYNAPPNISEAAFDLDFRHMRRFVKSASSS